MKRAATLALLLVIVVYAPVVWAQGSGAWTGRSQCWNGRVFVPTVGDCPATSSGGGAVGPPVIIWRRPSAAGSQMPGLAPVSPGLTNQLNMIADTPLTLMQKGEFAMKQGDLVRAKQYFDEASRRDPGNPEILQHIVELQKIFDSGQRGLGVQPFQLSEMLTPTPAAKVDKHMGDPEVRALREAEIEAFNKVANANDELGDITAKVKAGTAAQSDADKAQKKLDAAAEAFKQAQTNLKNKIYTLDPD